MRLFLYLNLIGICLFAPVPSLAWSENDARLGAQNHPKFLAQQGGPIKNSDLSDYIRGIGHKIVAQTPLAHERWVFSVTDTPVVNAFAAPGGYVYITRGLLALANSEAELAAVIGHEVAHLTASHHSKRQKRGNDAGIGVLVGTVLGGILGGKDGLKKGIELSSKVAAGYVGQFSQSQEFEADQLGTRYLAAANYNPHAQATILHSLGAKQSFEARRSGKEYNPNRVDFFATHPATADRVRKASDMAHKLGENLPRFEDEERYMAAIDGMIYGDSAEQGFVRGKTFIHPVIGFKYTVPQGFTITNSAQRIVAVGSNGAQFNLNSGGRANSQPSDYIRGVWVKQIARDVEVGRLSNITQFERNGVKGANAVLPYRQNGTNWLAHLTVIEHRGRFIRLTGRAKTGDRHLIEDFDRAAASFKALTESEAARARPYRLRSYRVQPEDTVEWLSLASPSQRLRKELFLTLNGLGSEAELKTGDIVKVITE